MSLLAKELNLPADIAAKRLLGCCLVRDMGDQSIVCKIVETEAYDHLDPASHSYRGITPRNEVMFREAGLAYVYFTYGMHHCLNVVVGPSEHGSAVLIRAAEPLSGLDLIKASRQKIKNNLMLTNGPGKICQALNIGREFNGHDLTQKPFRLVIKTPIKDSEIVVTKRIGITKATDKKRRFYIANNPYVSRYS